MINLATENAPKSFFPKTDGSNTAIEMAESMQGLFREHSSNREVGRRVNLLYSVSIAFSSMPKHVLVLVLFLVGSITVSAQQNSDPILVTGDELFGRVENGQSVREVIGHVVLRQGNVVITCERATQYLLQNNAHLMGNVIIKQDTVTIKTPEGFYYGNEKRAFSNRGIELDDKKVILTATEGEYFFKLQQANFRYNVKLYDTASTLTSQRLIYYRKLNNATAYENVKIVESENTIYSDSLIHLRTEKISYAFSNTLLHNTKDGLFIFGNHLEDYRAKNYSLIDKDPLLVQFDTTYNDRRDTIIRVDTMMIRSVRMEAYRDTSNLFIAKDSVKILRGDFSSVNDVSWFNRKDGHIDTWKQTDSSRIPVLWYGLSQMSGDSIRIYLADNKISSISISKNAMLISQNEKYPKRYDQISGNLVKLFFKENQLHRTEVLGNALSYYYFYDEDEETNGIIKASARTILVFFKDKKVQDVKMYGDPKNEYHPENLVENREKTFSLPGFVLFTDKPKKEQLLSSIVNSRLKDALEMHKAAQKPMLK